MSFTNEDSMETESFSADMSKCYPDTTRVATAAEYERGGS